MRTLLRVCLLLAILMTAHPAVSALVRPYPGYGNFPIAVDVAYRWRDDGALDVDVMIEVRSGHLLFVRPTKDLPFQADLDVFIRLEGLDGAVYELTRHQVIREQTVERAASTERVNTFAYTLENVTSPSGDLSVKVVDRHQERRGARGWRENPRAFSEMGCYWVAPRPPAEYGGFSLGDPYFLRDYSEVDLFGRRILHRIEDVYDALHDHLHLARQYGLRQRMLQFACEVHPPAEGRAAILEHEGLRVQVIHRELRFSTEDTLRFDQAQQTRLGLGEPVVVFHQLDVESLPPGAYLLSCAPLDGQGRPWLAEFDVVWSLGVPRRRGDEELALARLLFDPEQVTSFRQGDALLRQDMMDAFWDPLDPAPDTPQNEAWIEFQQRVGYVRQHLGGFGLEGSMDPRAEVYLRLGTPSRIAFETDTSNEAERLGPDQTEWTDFQGFVDTRRDLGAVGGGAPSPSVNATKGSVAFGTSTEAAGLAASAYAARGAPTSGKFPGSMLGPLVGTSMSHLATHSRPNTPGGEPVTETWFYAHGGFPLFAHAWSDSAPRGFQFAFTPRTGEYELRKQWTLEPEVFGVRE